MATGVSSVYLHVVDDVINSVRGDFQHDSIDETVLHELQTLWELKLMQAGAISASDIPPNLGVGRNVNVGSVQDLNIPYQGTEEFTPTSEMLFSPYATPTPGPEQTENARAGDQNKRRGVDVNVAYQEGQEEEEAGPGQAPVTKDFFTVSGKRKRDESFYPNNYIPQQDGGSDSMNFEIEFLPSTSRIPQRDGPADGFDDEVEHEDYNEPEEEGQQHNQQQPATELAQEAQVEAESGGEPPLNELDDDEDDLDGIDQPNDEPTTPHLVLAQFEKVTRSKNKWKCVLKDGIMRLNNRDILFVKATGEFEF